MASPFTFSTTKPASGDALNAFPAFAQAQWLAFATQGAAGGVLGTLLPFGAATTGWRCVQDINKVWLVTNAYLTASGGAWAQDDATKAGYGFAYDPTTNNDVEVIYMAAGQTTWTTLAAFPSVASAVHYMKIVAAATAGIAYISPEADVKGDLGTATVGFRQLYLRGTSGVVRYDDTTIMGITNKGGSGGGDYTTVSTTYVDVDAANLGLTVTVPTGWKLHVWAYISWQYGASGVNNYVRIVDGTAAIAEEIWNPDTATAYKNASLHGVVLGDGASHTVKLQWATANSGFTLTMANIALSTTTAVGRGQPRMSFLLMPSN